MPEIMLELLAAEFEAEGLVTEPRATLPGWYCLSQFHYPKSILEKKHSKYLPGHTNLNPHRVGEL